jgi:hypothetical protein
MTDGMPFGKQFPEVPTADGFVQYAIEDSPLRILVLDYARGGAATRRLLRNPRGLAVGPPGEQPQRPTLLVLPTTADRYRAQLDERNPDAEWVKRLHGIVSRHSNIVAMISGTCIGRS